MADNEETIERHEPGYDLLIVLSNMATECRLSFVPRTGACPFPEALLRQVLAEAGITTGIDGDAVASFSARAEAGERLADVPVARGTPSCAGRDAMIDFLVHPEADRPQFEAESDGRVDFRSTHLFENVRAGETIAVVRPPVQGTDGCTVRGEPIPAAPVSAVEVKAGPGVEYREGPGILTAMESGRVLRRNDTVSVSQELQVDGDVDYHVGHIDFVGLVDVRGDVLDGFNVRGKMGVLVRGNVGCCRIESDGDIAVGGMSGLGLKSGHEEHGGDGPEDSPHPEAVIRCGGNVTAKYLHNTVVECEGDVHVQKEVMHCEIKSAGSVVVAGLLVGGECVALGGIDAQRIGTEIGVRTSLTAGTDYRYAGYVHETRETLAEVQDRLRELAEITGLNVRSINPSSFMEQTRARLAHALAEIADLCERETKLKRDLAEMRELVSGKANAKINFTKELNVCTVLRLGSTVHEVHGLLSGPCSTIEYNSIEFGKDLRFLGLSPLSRTALQLRDELLDEDRREVEESFAPHADDGQMLVLKRCLLRQLEEA